MEPSLGLEVIALPMVDVDGVQRGDQGKGRTPHDHNRDYGSRCRYLSVRALRCAGLLGELATVALDLHTPGLRGMLEERPFLVASGDPGDLDRVAGFAAAIDDQHGRPEVMVFDQPWNSARSTGLRCFAAWVRSHQRIIMSATVEYPNAVIRGAPVTAPRARQFGRRLAAALPQVFA